MSFETRCCCQMSHVQRQKRGKTVHILPGPGMNPSAVTGLAALHIVIYSNTLYLVDVDATYELVSARPSI